MATGTERSKPLHNFTLPCDLRWGNQRFLRCIKVNSGGQISPIRRADGYSSSSSDHRIQLRRAARDRETERENDLSYRLAEAAALGGSQRFGYNDDDGGIAATREKVMLDLQTAADKMRNAFFKDGGPQEGRVSIRLLLPPPPPPPSTADASAEGVINRPWNLRTRRAAGRIPTTACAAAASGWNSGAGVKDLRVEASMPNPGTSQMPLSVAAAAQKSPIHRSDGGEAAASGEKKQRTKFSVALLKREIEEDFFSIAGHRPPRRPKKRPRTVQKQLDTLFPGLWLTEVTPDMYKVSESAP